MVDSQTRERARADFKIAMTGMGVAIVALAIIMGGAAFLAIALH